MLLQNQSIIIVLIRVNHGGDRRQNIAFSSCDAFSRANPATVEKLEIRVHRELL